MPELLHSQNYKNLHLKSVILKINSFNNARITFVGK